MPYSGQGASKSGHASFVHNPDISDFLEQCEYICKPGKEAVQDILSYYQPAPSSNTLPARLIACDASMYSEPFDNDFPNTQVGYVKISLVLVDLRHYAQLYQDNSRFVDPFKVAEMHRNAESITFTLPGSNIKLKGSKNVKDSFRRAIFEQFSDERTNFVKDGKYTLLDTLLAMCNNKISLKKCPNCEHTCPEDFIFTPKKKYIHCPKCESIVYMTDILRIHEQISDFASNKSAITRFMNAAEHLLLASLVYMLWKQQPETLADMAFVLDGPLAVFGQPAKLHAQLMRFYWNINNDLENRGLKGPVIIGLQKTGQVMDHAKLASKHLDKNTFSVLSDSYRAQYVQGYPSDVENFGHETYFGQDFIFKSSKGYIFVFAIPYPFKSKMVRATFAKQKIEIERYKSMLPRALDIIRHFECDLYENAVVPVALAHRHASISLVPGGKVLDMISRTNFVEGK